MRRPGIPDRLPGFVLSVGAVGGVGGAFIGRHAPAIRFPQVAGPGRASPVPVATVDTFRAPYAGESLTAALPGSSPRPWPSPWIRRLGSPLFPRRRLRFMLRTASLLPHERAFDAGLRPRPFPDEAASLLPGPLRHGFTSVLLGGRKIGAVYGCRIKS